MGGYFLFNNCAIHLFKTPMNCYLYDLNTNYFVKISLELYNFIQSDDAEKFYPQHIQKEIENLKDMGLLGKFPVQRIEHPENKFLTYKLDRHLNNLILQITQQCNLRCKYCVYSGSYLGRIHTEKNMSLEVAKKSIDFFLEHTIDSKVVSMAFYGGEPLLRFDFIKELIDYAKNKFVSKKIIFVITSNGTLLNEDIIKFFEENNVLLTISLDGDKRMHDKNRVFADSNKGTFDVITRKIEDLRKKYPEYFSTVRFNVVLDQRESFNCTSNFFLNYEAAKNGIVSPSSINDNYKINKISESEQFSEEYDYEKFKLLLSKIGAISGDDISVLIQPEFISIMEKLNNRSYSPLSSTNHHSGPCIPGVQKLFITADGKFYPCERVNEESYVMNIGHIDDGFYENKILELMNIGKLTEVECTKCWAFRFCTLCAIYADNDTALSRDMKLKKCAAFKADFEMKLKDYFLLKELESFDNKE